MAKTITETTDQQGAALDTAKPRKERNGSGETAIAKGSPIGGQYQRLRSFLDDVRAEMRKVVWPSREDVQSTTGVVLLAVFLFAGYFAVVDFVFGQGITRLIQHFTAH